MTTTTNRRGVRAPLPGEREGVLALLGKANAASAARATPHILPVPESGCRECAMPKVRTDGAGNRIVYPCSACGAIRG